MNKKTARLKFDKADSLYRQGRHEQALIILAELNQEFPNEKHIMYAAARCMNKVGHFDEAKALCHQMIRVYDYEKARQLLERIEVAQQTSPTQQMDPDQQMGAAQQMGIAPLDSAGMIGVPPPPRPAMQPHGQATTRRSTAIPVFVILFLAAALFAGLAYLMAQSGGDDPEAPIAVPLLLTAIVYFSFVGVYLFYCYVFKRICENADSNPGILIWVPILSIFPIMRAARMSYLWLLVNFIPGIGALVFLIVLSVQLCIACGKPPWVAIFAFIPGTNFAFPLYLAFSPSEEGDRLRSDEEQIFDDDFEQSPRMKSGYLLLGLAVIALVVIGLPFVINYGNEDDAAEKPKEPAPIAQTPTAQTLYETPESSYDPLPGTTEHSAAEPLPFVPPPGEPAIPGADITIMLPGDVPLELVKIPAGAFLMGRTRGETDSNEAEDPQHAVTIADDFWMGMYEVTQQQWLALLARWPDEAPSEATGLGDNYPAYNISWNDAQRFLALLNAHIRDTGQERITVRLPSEAEWEYACRANTRSRFYWGEDAGYARISDYAWYQGNNTPPGAKPVGDKIPNAFGLYDMSGNVFEWCEDDLFPNYRGAPASARVWMNSPRHGARVIRGGSWNMPPHRCRSAERYGHNAPSDRLPDIGFRVAAER